MVEKFIKLFVQVFLIFLAAGPLWAASSSASYKVTSEILDSGAASSSSTSFRVLAKTRDYQTGQVSSASFIFGAGFLKSAYFGAVVILNPVVTSITPSSANNTGPVNITALSGANFQTGATVKLQKTGQADIAATNVVVVSSSSITCTFDLTDKASGAWNVVVTNPDGGSGSLPSAFTINFAAPTIVSITPNKGNNNAPASITNLAGTNLRSGATVKLSKTGDNDIIATGVTVVSANQITCTYDITNKTVGAWDVVVTNSDDQSATLAQGFKIESPTVQVIGPVTAPSFNALTGSTTISYTLSQDVDITIDFFNLYGERIYTYNAPAGTNGGRVGLNQIEWNGITAFGQKVSFGVYIMMVNARSDGKITTLAKQKIAVIK